MSDGKTSCWFAGDDRLVFLQKALRLVEIPPFIYLNPVDYDYFWDENTGFTDDIYVSIRNSMRNTTVIASKDQPIGYVKAISSDQRVSHGCLRCAKNSIPQSMLGDVCLILDCYVKYQEFAVQRVCES